MASGTNPLDRAIALASALLAGRDFIAALAQADMVISRTRGMASAHFIRGTALHELGRSVEAAESLQRAVALAPADATAWLNLGVTLTARDQLAAAERALRRACALAPACAEAQASLGTTLLLVPRLTDAIAAYQSALRLRPDFNAARWDLGFALLLSGDFPGGFAAMVARKPEENATLQSRGLTNAEWNGADLAGGTLLVCSSQGLGDAIQFARFLPQLMARGLPVALLCDASLARLMNGLGVAVSTPQQPLPPHHSWVALSSLPRLLATTAATIPLASGYLAAAPARVAHWHTTLPPGPRVGLVWAGNPAHANDLRRSMSPVDLAPLLALGGVNFVSLQRDSSHVPQGVLDLAPDLTDLAETAAVICALDLVITIDTAVVHLAGALGRPAWLALPHVPDWRWQLGRADSPWYNSVRLFRQQTPGDWGGVVRDIAAALINRPTTPLNARLTEPRQ